MEDSMYYTFSTISQVLAAFIALSGVFVLFKLQENKKLLMFLAKKFVFFFDHLKPEFILLNAIPSSCFVSNDKIKSRIESKDHLSILLIMEQLLSDLGGNKSPLNNIYDMFKEQEDKRRIILRLTKYSSITGAITIVFAIMQLIIVTKTVNYYNSLLWIGFALSALCIILMTITIYVCLNEKAQRPA